MAEEGVASRLAIGMHILLKHVKLQKNKSEELFWIERTLTMVLEIWILLRNERASVMKVEKVKVFARLCKYMID